MRAVIQRVARARVTVEDREIAAIGRGALVLLGVDRRDPPDAASKWSMEPTRERTMRHRKALAATSKTRQSPSQRQEASCTKRERLVALSRAAEKVVKSRSPRMVAAIALSDATWGRRKSW